MNTCNDCGVPLDGLESVDGVCGACYKSSHGRTIEQAAAGVVPQKRCYVVIFENYQTGVKVTFDDVYADHTTAAQFHAGLMLKNRDDWECIGIDRKTS